MTTVTLNGLRTIPAKYVPVLVTAGLFVAEDCGQHALKGLSAPTLYRVVRASGGRRRGGGRALTPRVGARRSSISSATLGSRPSG